MFFIKKRCFMTPDGGFGTIKFDYVMPHAGGRIKVAQLGITPECGASIMWGIEEGSSYPPQTHAHAHNLIVLQGSGVVSIDGVEQPYNRGSSFWVPGNVPHGFVRVDAATLVVEQQR